MIGKTISHCKILEKLGEEEIGVVHKAEDRELKRAGRDRMYASLPNMEGVAKPVCRGRSPRRLFPPFFCVISAIVRHRAYKTSIICS